MATIICSFSDGWSNLAFAYNLWIVYYNLCRIHKALGVTPAIESEMTGHAWSIQELLQQAVWSSIRGTRRPA
jgi:hypothetical protein